MQNRQKRFEIFAESVESFCSAILEKLGEPARTVSIAFVSARVMRALNRRHRGKDYPTDVLSFRYPGEKLDGLPFLGEIIISPEIAWRQARSWNEQPERELRKLLLHGILHLLGYDHETDKGEMNRLQRQMMLQATFVKSPPVADMRSGR